MQTLLHRVDLHFMTGDVAQVRGPKIRFVFLLPANLLFSLLRLIGES